MTMTTNTDSADDIGGGPGMRRWWHRRSFSRAETTDSALMIGTLSIVCFWAPGVGVILGILALVAATWADRSSVLAGARASRSDALLAYGSGILGVIAGIGFVLMVFPHW